MFPLGMAKRQTRDTSDAENTAFGLPEYLADHKPGFDHEGPKREIETGDNHRFRRSQKKDVPQKSLADRIGKSKKGK